MTDATLIRVRPLKRLRVALGVFLLVTCLLGLWVLGMDINRQLDQQSGAKLDNVQWGLSQVEVELVSLVLASERATDDGGTLAEVRLRYDVFYSRLETLKTGSLFAGMRQTPEFVECILPLDGFLTAYLPIIDGSDPVLRQNLPQLTKDASAMLTEAREIALAGVAYFAKVTDAQRHESETTLAVTAALAIFLITSLVGLIVLLLRLGRVNQRHTVQNLQTLSRLDAIVSTAQEAIITADGMGRIVDVNAAATQTFGYDKDEVIGADLAGLLSDASAPQAVFVPRMAPSFWGPGQVRLTARHKTGRSIPVEVSISRTVSGDGPLYVAFLRDMSAQLAAEQAMMAARDEALAGEKAKADLLVVMSHEIRTPLNGMIGTIDLLGGTPLAADQKEYLRILEASGRLLMHHVNDVLDIARLDSGKAAHAAVPVDLDLLVQEVLENQGPSARRNGNTMRYDAPAKRQSVVLVDGALLRQVLLNLVGNAVKFTHDGDIVVGIGHHSEQGLTEITVSDTGIGIAMSDVDRIFDDFVTLDATYAREAGGTGLGLGIVRRIVGHLGGTIAVDSTPGQGSLFRILLPLPLMAPEPADSAALHSATTPNGPRMTTLVVEDNAFNRKIISDMLRQEGHDVVEAHDGMDGIIRAAERRFDLILMDISMPQIDGLQAARAIAGGPGLSRATRIVAMTAHALAEDVERFKAAGMQDALIKPITRQAMRRALAGQDPGAPAPASAVLVDLAVLQDMQGDLGRKKASDLVGRFLAETGQTVALLATPGHQPKLGRGSPDFAGLDLAGPDLAGIDFAGLDWGGLHHIHQLEGSAAMFGAQALRQALSHIQTLWKSGAKDEAQRGLPGLLVLWQQTSQAYSEMGFFPQPSSLR